RHVRLLGEPVEVPNRLAHLRGRPATVLAPGIERLLPELARCPALVKLRGLDLSGLRFEVPTFEALLRSPHFPPLEALDVSQTALTSDEGARLLARSPQLEPLTSLALSGRRRPPRVYQREAGSVGPEAMGALAHSPHLARVTRLHLGCSAGDPADLIFCDLFMPGQDG